MQQNTDNEQQLQQLPQRPLHQFQVTKLRSWRTGYVRLLVLYPHDFGTLDPTSSADGGGGIGVELKETNRWPYSSLTDWMAVPGKNDNDNTSNNSILLQVGDGSGEKLKFNCHAVHRSRVLTALLQQQYESGQAANQQRLPVFAAHRWKRAAAQAAPTPQPVLLQIKPYGITELHGTTKRPLQTYLYTSIRAVSFPTAASPDGTSNATTEQQTGLFIHFHHQPGKVRFYTISDNIAKNTTNIPGSGRTALVKLVSEQFGILGLPHPIPMEPSCTVASWMEQRASMNISVAQNQNNNIGSIAMQWSVTKSSRRHDSAVIGNASMGATPGGIVSRRLAVTGMGYLVELDNLGVVNCRRLRDLYALVRNDNVVTLEFNDGSVRRYTTSQQADAMIVSILDAATQLSGRGGQEQQNTTVHITNHPSAGYCLQHSEYDAQKQQHQHQTPTSAVAAAMFQPTPVPQYLLKRVYTLSTHAYALVSGEFGSGNDTNAPPQPLHQQASSIDLTTNPQCWAVVTVCREFNASVQHANTELSHHHHSNDKQIIASMGALFGLTARLLVRNSGTLGDSNNSRKQQVKEQMASTLFQTLYRLAKTTTGYKCSADLTTLRDVLPLMWNIEDTFCKYSAYYVLNVLLSGTDKDNKSGRQRDMEAEYVNKNVLLKSGGPAMVDGLVTSLLPNSADDSDDGENKVQSSSKPFKQVSDLILMVTSDILQSLLCSYHDTTSPEHFQAFIGALAHRYRALLSTLRSPTPFVIENTALLLDLLSTHAPQSAAAIRDAALSSAILLQHFYSSTFSPLEGQRFLSRYLCSLWLSGPMNCDEKRLLKRMVPHGFLAFLNMPALSRMEEEQLDQLERDAVEGNITDAGAAAEAALASQNKDNPIAMVQSSSQVSATAAAGGTNTARLRARIALATATAANAGHARKENFRIFFHVLTQDHSLADLIWSQQTRRELRIALESEIEYIRRETEARGVDAIAWNHQQFQVKYPSLDNEVKVGNVYMRLWLQAGDGFIRSWDEPVRLFEHLFRRFLCEVDRNIKVTVMCIRCLERLYAIHASSIGPFTDVMILVRCMASTNSVETQHRLLGLLATVLGVSEDNKDERYSVADVPENAEQLLNIESISQLCQFVAWGHTNGDQVGNMLTRVLAVGKNGKDMITDGTNAGPEGSGGVKSDVAGDSSCPPVWFVSSTGKIPPPADSVRGPFRVSDLAKMMEDGELTPYHLVTTSHVEEYDLDDDSQTVQETQVDTGKWKRLNEVWQLRWELCTDGSSSVIYSPSDVAQLALKALVRLMDLHRSVDSCGKPYVPIPLAKRILSGRSGDQAFASDRDGNATNPLPIVSQALLCNDSRIVGQAAELIYKLCLHNERAVSKLYLSGVFYFAFCYAGSDFNILSKLIHATHLKQNFKSGFSAAADESELPMRERSILGHMLPEGLLFILTNYGPDRFSEVFVGNADTPEVIWTFDMRKHLIEMIRQHLGDFPLRLFQNNTTEYEYCPMPGVAYKRLEKEIFCHNYYLHNLCDEVRFPDWPISEPLEVMRACLERFKRQLDHDDSTEEEALEKARLVLNLQPGGGSKELRRAYRSLARKWHPDKNPAGRETFESIQTSYEILLPFVESGEKIRVFAEVSGKSEEDADQSNSFSLFPAGKSQMETMDLLIKTQLLICRRYEKDMARHKYPAYAILLSCINLPDGSYSLSDEDKVLQCPFASAERALFIQSVVELIYRTCLISPQNAEELVLESGVAILASLLDFFVTVARVHKQPQMESDARKTVKLASDTTIADIIAHTVHTLSGVAYFESGRAAMKSLSKSSQFLINWRRCLDESMFTAKDGKVTDALMKRYALEGISNMAKDATLREGLVGCGVIWPLLRFTLLFDPTLEQASANNSDHDDLGISVASINIAARLSVRALGVLSGMYGDGPRNEPLCESLNVLLTPPIARMLRSKRTDVILRILNTNVERADIIWHVQMRNQLESTLSRIEKERPEDILKSLAEELKLVGDFRYEVLNEEIRIGGIYVRFFNKGGKDSLANVENPSKFLASVVNFVGRSLNRSLSAEEGWIDIAVGDDEPSSTTDEIFSTSSLSSTEFLLSMNALRILCRTEGLMDDALHQTPSILPAVLLSLLELPLHSEGYEVGGEILYSLSSKHTFADAVTKENSFWRLLQLLERKERHEINEKANERYEAAGEGSRDMSQRKSRGWEVLEALSSTTSVAACILSTPGWIELLGVLVGYVEFTKLWTARIGAAKTLSRLLWDPKLGLIAESSLKRFLPTALVIRLKEDPESMLKDFDGDSDTPELIWESTMRGELRKVLGKQLDLCMQERKEGGGKANNFALGPEVFVQYSKLEDELYIGGVYVSRFLKEPTYSLRDPTAFLELLLQRWTKELATITSGEESIVRMTDSNALTKAGQDILELLTTASVYLCKVRGSLCDKLASWGYMSRSVTFVNKSLERELIGTPLLSAIRLLHVASDRMANVEQLALVGQSDGKDGVVNSTKNAIGLQSLHTDTAFMIEFLLKLYRVALGDLKRGRQQGIGTQQQPSAVVMAPSPAPGEGPVRKKVSIGDDPLGMFHTTSQQPVEATPLRQPQQSMGQQGLPVSQYPRQNLSGQSPQAVSTTPYAIRGNQGIGQQQQQQQPSYQQQPQVASPYGQASYPFGGGQQQQSQPQVQSNQMLSGLPQQAGQNSFVARAQHLQSNQPSIPYSQQQRQSSNQIHDSGPGLQNGQPMFGRVGSYTHQQQQQQPQQRGFVQPAGIGAPQHATQQPNSSGRAEFSRQQQQQQSQQPQNPVNSRPFNFADGQAPQNYSQQQQQYSHQPHQSMQSPLVGQNTQTTQSSQQIPGFNATAQQQPANGQYSSSSMAQDHLSSSQQQQQQQQYGTDQPNRTQSNAHIHMQPAGYGQTSYQTGRQPQSQHMTPEQQRQHAPTQHMQQPQSGQLMTPPQQQQQQQQHVQMNYSQNQNAQSGMPNSSAPSQVTQSVQFSQTGGISPSGVPIVETVAEPAPIPVPQYGPTATVGSGIDARSAEDPRAVAEQQSVMSNGAPGSAQGRVSLLQQAIACKLCGFLVDDVLENETLKEVRDPAATKVHAIDLLKLLCKDPGFGQKFKLILNDLPAWKKYKSQDHSLLITGHEQKADYFLTDGGSEKEKKLLTER